MSDHLNPTEADDMSTFKTSAWMSMVVFGLLGVCSIAEAKVVYVATTGSDDNDGLSWPTAKRTVQAGLNAAQPDDQAWVAAGTYVECITLTSGVALYGGFAGAETALAQRDWQLNQTILDGNAAGTVVTSPSGVTSTTRIDGFTIRNGTALYESYRYVGGGVYCEPSSAVIANNTITNNAGWGIDCDGKDPLGANTITNNTIANNYGSGVRCERTSTGSITNNTITNNANHGIEGTLAYSPTIRNNRITDNQGSGIWWHVGSPTITGNVITGNGESGVKYYEGNPPIRNNIITSNGSDGICCFYCYTNSNSIANNRITGNGGAGISSTEGYHSIVNNTITHNSTGLLLSSSSAATIANSIIAFNSAGVFSSSGSLTLRSNCVYGNTDYNYSQYIGDPTQYGGNISADPRLANAPYGNVHLQPGSPCIDAGDDSLVKSGWTDADGQARITGAHVDIGADESDGTRWPQGPPAIVRVSPDGNDANDGSSWTSPKRTVQAAIDIASTTGGDVWVKTGTYLERIGLQPHVYVYGGFTGTEMQQSQRDWNTNATILDGQGGGSVVTVEGCGNSLSAIDGFTIRNGNASYGGGIYCASSLMIRNDTIMNNSAQWGAGLYCDGSSPTITNSIIRNNEASYGGAGIVCDHSSAVIANSVISGNAASAFHGGGIACGDSSPTIANCTIIGNTAPAGGGVSCISSSSPAIVNTIIAFNSSGLYGNTSEPSLGFNCIYGNTDYNYSGLTDPTGTGGNISTDPLLTAVADGDVHLQPNSPCVDAGDDSVVKSGWTDIDGQDRLTRCHVDIGADELLWPDAPLAIVRVSPEGDDADDGSSWDTPKRTVQAAIDAATTSCGEVWVKTGTYLECITLRPSTRLYGGFSGAETQREQRDWHKNTTILDGQAQGSVVTAAEPSCARSTIDGFTIRNGTGTQSSESPEVSMGGGIYCNDCALTIANNTITGNNCRLGAGIYCARQSLPDDDSPTIANNTLVGNTAVFGGGIAVDCYSSPTITNNTIVGNTASNEGGGGIDCFYSAPTIVNTIIAFNSSGIYVYEEELPYEPSTLSLQFNCLFGNTFYDFFSEPIATNPIGINDNISADPRFVRPPSPGTDGQWGTTDDDLGNLHLTSGSPCIDAGDNGAVPAGILTDLAGLARFFDDPATPDTGIRIAPIVDMGAYEYHTPTLGDFDLDGDVDADDLNTFLPCLSGPTISYADGCAMADLDGDEDIDQSDFGLLQRCFSGADTPPDCGG